MARGERDDLVVAAARTGDPDAWRELYTRHNGRLTVWLRTHRSPDVASSAEDVAAEAWLTAAAKINDYQGSDEDFPGWLFTIARNHASNSRRRAIRRRTDPISVQDAPETTWGYASTDVSSVDDLETTRHLLEHLSPREAEVVACIDVVGLDVAATAAALGMTSTAVRVARHRALGRLRRVLAQEDTAVTPASGIAPTLPTSAAP